MKIREITHRHPRRLREKERQRPSTGDVKTKLSLAPLNYVTLFIVVLKPFLCKWTQRDGTTDHRCGAIITRNYICRVGIWCQQQTYETDSREWKSARCGVEVQSLNGNLMLLLKLFLRLHSNSFSKSWALQTEGGIYKLPSKLSFHTVETRQSSKLQNRTFCFSISMASLYRLLLNEATKAGNPLEQSQINP